ncbi:MAG: SDR family oxidoreductase [Methylobacterium sp.]|jgi:2-keto-3-deoxy-L-fuconate dehydrogenase|nr:SDR family oxidoreductase [Methylobacterium sp.]MCA3602338.1 SDR family oxidoreductase [Methylobacterium sp.]MCA3610957.1 SDR family oxidoreductase [Methylobacterium sp.]MCA3613944.1 SDR family oxidoreductase [Methylobacterium sp.]MCA3622539.1 SDR family oxidoreductase [Methylobacterium sp.]
MTAQAGKLAGRVAVITGGASGIGLASATRFVAEGASVVLVDRDDAALSVALANLPSHSTMAIVGDVSAETAVSQHADAVLERFGRIDILLAAAGFSTGTSVPDTVLDAWHAVIGTNLTGTFLWCRAVLGPMRAQRAGSIILVGSQLAFAGGRANAAYLASKGAIVSLAQTMAVDHAAEGIRVNVLVPGAIDTPLLARAFARATDPEAVKARSISRHPLGRLGQAEEVAAAALFLASDESSFTTGSCLRVDGGWLAG